MRVSRTALFAGMLLLVGCDRGRETPASGYRHLGDQLKASTWGLFGFPCTQKSKAFPDSYESTPAGDCYRFDPPRQMSGIWFNDFEGQRFVPDGAPAAGNEGDIWIENDHPGSGLPRDKGANFGKRYAVTFIGRMTSKPGAYGHMGGSANMVLVVHLLSIRELPAQR